ncbi:MAG TPA: DUF748 domain-containing protein, partial [Terriglobales bacterium]|nr:DUF748 domain-containing protein [Terriglobales bacterium]
VELNSPMPGGGRLGAVGTAALDPVRLDLRVALDGVSIEPAQSYLPLHGRVAGEVTGDVNVKLALEPVSVQATGQMRLQRFRLLDGDRAVVSVSRVETSGLDVDWPRRLAIERVLLRRPRLLVERAENGEIALQRLLELRWDAPAAGGPSAPAAAPTAAATAQLTPTAPPPVEIGTLVLERASARFVDHSTTPDYVEELTDVDVTVTGLSTAPGRRTRFTAKGELGGGTFSMKGETVQGDRELIDVKLELRDFILPRANPYLDRFTAWTATNGTLDLTASYTLNGTRLEARQDVRVRDLDVAPVDERDEVERRVGLPFGMLVSLLKDSRDQITLSLPVSGDISTREFQFSEAVWGAVRSLSLRLVALPFSKIGSLFVSHDSKVEAVAIKPVVFMPGTAQPAAGMDAHLRDVAKFLKDTPAVTIALRPILTQADVDALRAAAPAAAAPPAAPVPADAAPTTAAPAAARAPVPREALRDLAGKRLEAVRQTVAADGIDPARLTGTARGMPLIEAAGDARVELNLRGGREVSSTAER